jgi:hypothetical protein
VDCRSGRDENQSTNIARREASELILRAVESPPGFGLRQSS